ncbi:MAG: FAD-dependent oxidoreductase [Dehalococcoidales bacterium]|nr:FAD-dependent oxidoreductase [Dehalococcoidales bacterium]
MEIVIEEKRETPVFYNADVIVVGGGPAGIGAALAAARNGAKTILIEQFGALGGQQSLGMSSSFSLVDTEIQGGIILDIIDRLRKNGAIQSDSSAKSRKLGFSSVAFDMEFYKFLLDNMMAEAGVKLLYHTFGVGAIKESNTLKGVLIECLQGRFAVLGKVIIDTTGSADIAWKSGAPCFDDGHTKGPKKGRHMGLGCRYYLSGVDAAKYKKFREANPDEWTGMYVGRSLIEKAITEGKYHGYRKTIVLHAYRSGIAMLEGISYPLPMGHHGWMIEDVTAGEIDIRKQIFSAWKLIKDNVPGFENTTVDKMAVMPILRDTHRIIGDYVLTEKDVANGAAFDDSIAISNMVPDIYGPDGEHYYEPAKTLPHDIPYRCLISKETENLMGAGATISADFTSWAAVRYCAPSMCTGQAAGTAAALAVKDKVSLKKLDVKKLQSTLQKQGARTSVKNVPKDVLAEYRESRKTSLTIAGE